MKKQCPALPDGDSPLFQTELFDAGLLRAASGNGDNPVAYKCARTAVETETAPPQPPALIYHNPEHDLRLFHGNCLDLLSDLATRYPEGCVDMVFADPTYFLSNNGSSCHGGERVLANKGQWDKSRGLRQDLKFTLSWLRGCRRVLLPGGTIWVSGTHHSIHLTGYVLQKLRFKILNDITWEKTNPPPNLACRQFTHSNETLIWAARDEDADHIFNYDLMRCINRGSQMQSVWRLNAPPPAEKLFGEHPTQKPVALAVRCILAATCEGDLVLDPFLGSGTAAIACLRHRRRFVGVDLSGIYARLATARCRAELEQGLIELKSAPEIVAT